MSYNVLDTLLYDYTSFVVSIIISLVLSDPLGHMTRDTDICRCISISTHARYMPVGEIRGAREIYGESLYARRREIEVAGEDSHCYRDIVLGGNWEEIKE